MRPRLTVSVLTMGLFCLGAHGSTINFDHGSGALITYAENGYTVANTSGQWGFSSGFGNPAPSIYAHSSSSITVTDAGALFELTSVDFANDAGSASYTLQGFNGSVLEYTVSSTLPTYRTASGIFRTYASGESNVGITSLMVAVNGANFDANVDDVTLSAIVPSSVTPEPLYLAQAFWAWLYRKQQNAPALLLH